MPPVGRWASPSRRMPATQKAIAKELASAAANHANERSMVLGWCSASGEIQTERSRCCFMRGQHSLRCGTGGTWMRYVLSHLTRPALGLPTTLAIPVLAVGAVEAPLRRRLVALARNTQHFASASCRTSWRAILLPAIALRTDLGLRATKPADEHALARGRILDRSLQPPGAGPARSNPRCSNSLAASSDVALVSRPRGCSPEL